MYDNLRRSVGIIHKSVIWFALGEAKLLGEIIAEACRHYDANPEDVEVRQTLKTVAERSAKFLLKQPQKGSQELADLQLSIDNLFYED